MNIVTAEIKLIPPVMNLFDIIEAIENTITVRKIDNIAFF